jgi:hypothetical protein
MFSVCDRMMNEYGAIGGMRIANQVYVLMRLFVVSSRLETHLKT